MSSIPLSDGTTLAIRSAIPTDLPVIFKFIRELAEYEKLEKEVVATEALLKQTLFGDQRFAEVLIGDALRALAAFIPPQRIK